MQQEEKFLFEPPIQKKLGKSVAILQDVKKEFQLKDRDDRVVALSNICLSPNNEFYSIRKGEFVVLRGPSGGGKTTFLNMLGTIDRISSGTINLLGTEITSRTPDHILSKFRLEKIGFVFQTFNLLSALSAFENVELPMTLLNSMSREDRRKRSIELLTLVGLGDRINHIPSELSGGEQQRVTIARALANKPELLLLDEPTGDLDSRNTVEVMNLILKINQETQTTVVMVTHNEHLECYADRILYMEDGKIVSQAINSVQSALDFDTYYKLQGLDL
eukprot:c18819_g1_i1.p1 GENE.c18819_g1_i1~~c18819_g1_i1.p1  ORF type:complete len:283 (+),score=80.09 c18819_g1_i1:22-849(+)